MQLLNKIALPATAGHDMTRVRAAATAFFAVDGFIFASWAVRIPAAMARAGLLAGPNGVAVASTLGYAGFLPGPPAIGFLAGTVSLGVA